MQNSAESVTNYASRIGKIRMKTSKVPCQICSMNGSKCQTFQNFVIWGHSFAQTKKSLLPVGPSLSDKKPLICLWYLWGQYGISLKKFHKNCKFCKLVTMSNISYKILITFYKNCNHCMKFSHVLNRPSGVNFLVQFFLLSRYMTFRYFSFC